MVLLGQVASWVLLFVTLDRAHYNDQCALRWSGEPLRDARRNWHHYQGMQGDLVTALLAYKRNPMLHDGGEFYGNPDGTLTSFLWKLQDAWQPDKSCLAPLLDFCDHYQKIFLRRGLLIYCTTILRHLEAGEPLNPAQATLPLAVCDAK